MKKLKEANFKQLSEERRHTEEALEENFHKTCYFQELKIEISDTTLKALGSLELRLTLTENIIWECMDSDQQMTVHTETPLLGKYSSNKMEFEILSVKFKGYSFKGDIK